MRFIVLGLLRAWAHSKETPVQAATGSLSGCVIKDEGKGDDECADQKTVACFFLKCAT
jgi:hypothetical protein